MGYIINRMKTDTVIPAYSWVVPARSYVKVPGTVKVTDLKKAISAVGESFCYSADIPEDHTQLHGYSAIDGNDGAVRTCVVPSYPDGTGIIVTDGKGAKYAAVEGNVQDTIKGLTNSEGPGEAKGTKQLPVFYAPTGLKPDSGGGGGGTGTIHTELSIDEGHTKITVTGDDTMKGETVCLFLYDSATDSIYTATQTIDESTGTAELTANDFAVNSFADGSSCICYNNCVLGSGFIDYPVQISEELDF
jgi:hypothetical protein